MMTAALTVSDLFAVAGLAPCGPVQWEEPCEEHGPGVYIIAINNRIVYIGQTKRPLSRRLREFYRHKYGDKGPHRGGQEILNLPGDRLIYWSVTNDPVSAEYKMIAAYENCFRCCPLGNKKRGDRSRAVESASTVINIDDDENVDWLHSKSKRI
jgi:GIY-YIG catalytic domain-containing protein